MILINEYNFRIFFIINLYFLLSQMKIAITDEFIEIKKLFFTNKYFVVLDTGLYLYNMNTLDCSLIHKFNSTVYKRADNKILVDDLEYKNKLYILCVVNEYLFIFNAQNNRTISFKINELESNKDNYYNILPYKIQNDIISFIIVVCENSNKLIFYYYNFSLKEKSNQPK